MRKVGGLESVLDSTLNATQRGEALDHLILEWLYRFRYSTEYALCRLKAATEGLKASELDNKLRTEFAQRYPEKTLPAEMAMFKSVAQANFRKKLKRMLKAKLIVKFELYIGRSKYGYRLTKAGAQRLQKYSDDYEVNMFNLSGVISNRKASHCIAEQLILVNKVCDAVKRNVSIKYATEKELSLTRDMKDVKRPDILISLNDSSPDAYEVELTRKSTTEVHQAFLRNENLLATGRVARVIYLLSTQSFENKYKVALSNKNGIPIYEYNAKKRKPIATDERFHFSYKDRLKLYVKKEFKEFM